MSNERVIAEPPARTHRLAPCPDCEHTCSTRAEHCPNCGHFFRRYTDTPSEITISQKGWVNTIASGIVLGWIFIGILTVGLVVVLFILGVGLSVPRR